MLSKYCIDKCGAEIRTFIFKVVTKYDLVEGRHLAIKLHFRHTALAKNAIDNRGRAMEVQDVLNVSLTQHRRHLFCYVIELTKQAMQPLNRNDGFDSAGVSVLEQNRIAKGVLKGESDEVLRMF